MNLNNSVINKAFALYSSSILGIILGFGISIFNTRVLGKDSFGDFKFIEMVFRFFASLISFGIFISITRMLAIAKSSKSQKNLLGLFSLSYVIIGVIGIIIILVFSYISPIWFASDLSKIFRTYSFLILAVLGNLALSEILKGLNKIYTLSLFNLVPGILYLTFSYNYNNYYSINLEDILLFYYGFQLLVIIIIIMRLRPSLNLNKTLIKKVLKENESNGRPIYIGSLAGVATTHIVGFSLSYYIDNTQVGFFTLALTLCSPLLIIPSVLGTTLFKSFTNLGFIPKKIFIFSIIATFVALIIFYLIIDKIFLFFYSEEFSPVINISKILIIGFMLHGLGDLINRFLGAKGQGNLLRNAAFVVGLVNILGYSILVYYFGTSGAIATKILASGVYLLMMIYYYKKIIK